MHVYTLAVVAVVLAAPLALANPRPPVRDITVTRVYASPDGVRRPVIAVNGQFPAPPIFMTKGEDLIFRVKNRLPTMPTSFHAHGFHQKGTPFYDGASGVSQCPIRPGDELEYHIRSGEQAGTTFYHAHYGAEYTDGFAGPLIVQDPDDPHRRLYDEELVVTLSDWFHEESAIVIARYLSPASQGNEPMPISGLINGKGRFDCTKAAPGTICQPGAVRESFEFVPGRRYRLRVINMSAFASFQFSIDNHRLTVIEADMVNINKVTVDRININVAQRYSVIVKASAQPGNYWMRATMATGCFPVPAPNLDRNIVARVHYRGAVDRDPTSPINLPTNVPNEAVDCIDFDPKLIRPLHQMDVIRPTEIIKLDIQFNPDAAGVVRGSFNNVSYVPDYSRSMLQDIVSGRIERFPRSRNVYQVPFNAEVRFILRNMQEADTHPFHLHGFTFQVLATGKGEYDPRTTPLMTRNPPRRDTFTIPGQGFGVIQFRANNLGLFPGHCHMVAHSPTLFMVLQVGSAKDLSRLDIPDEVWRMCSGDAHGGDPHNSHGLSMAS